MRQSRFLIDCTFLLYIYFFKYIKNKSRFFSFIYLKIKTEKKSKNENPKDFKAMEKHFLEKE
jgi:hypothetical protein